MKTQKIFYIRTDDLDLYKKVVKAAEKDKRSVSKYVEKLLSDNLNQRIEKKETATEQPEPIAA